MRKSVKIAVLAGSMSLVAGCASSADGGTQASASAVDYPPLTVGAQSEEGVAGVLFVANKFGNTLSAISLRTGEELKRVKTCTNPHELATSPNGEYVALACYGGQSIDIYSADDLSGIKSIDLGNDARPHGIVWHANGDIYATGEGRKSVFWIHDPIAYRSEALEYSTGKEGSHMIAVSPSGNHAWTTDLGSKTVSLIDLKTRRAPKSVEVGIEPEGISLSPDGKALWVSARGSNKAFELDPMSLTVRREVSTGRFPLRLAINPSGTVAATSDLADGSLSIIDLKTAKVIRTIAVSSAEEAEERFQVTILWSGDGERIYVAETGTDTIAEVSYTEGRVLRRLKAGDGGDGLAILGEKRGFLE